MSFFRDNILKIVIMFAVVIVLTIIFSFMFTSKKSISDSYEKMELQLKEAAINYVNSNKRLLPKEEGAVKRVNLDSLVNAKEIKQLYAVEDSNIACTGYVNIVMKDKEYLYKPYVKCGKYYETLTVSQYIKSNEDIVLENDGLYNMNGKFVYRGENPNNNILLGEKLYKIIEITENNELKLISTVSYDDDVVWDDRYNGEKDENVGINDYSKSRIKDTLEEAYKSDFFTNSDREKIVKHDLCIGKRSLNDHSIDGTAECSIIEKDQYIGLIQLNEYMRASIDQKCQSTQNPECENYNYLYNVSRYMRTLNGVLENTYQIYRIDYGVSYATYASNSFTVYPVIYLDKDVLYKKGDGTLDNPYVIR